MIVLGNMQIQILVLEKCVQPVISGRKLLGSLEIEIISNLLDEGKFTLHKKVV